MNDPPDEIPVVPPSRLLPASGDVTVEYAHLRAVFEAAVDAIITIDTSGVIQRVNPATSRIFGYEPEELVGQRVNLLLPSPHREEQHCDVVSYLETRKIASIGECREVIGQRRDGLTVPLDLAVSEVWLGGERYFTGVVRDITLRKQAEQAQLARHHRLERVVAANPLVVYLALDVEQGSATVTWLTANFQTLYGYPANQTYPLTWWLERIHPFDRPAAESQLAEFLARSTPGPVVKLLQEYRFRCAGGSYRWMRADLRFLENQPERRAREVVGSLADVTEVKKAASEREQVHERLEHRNQELQALLQHAQRMTPLGTMAAGLAHEICNPLTVLRLSLFSIRASLGQAGAEGGALPARDELDKDLRMIGEEIDRLEQLARKYLDYSRLGEQQLHAEPIGAILASAVSLISHRIRETGVAVTVDVEPDLPLVRVDAGQIKQVLLNLLGNALDVLPLGGTIRMSARPGTDPEGKGQVVVEVRDNGPGIPNEVVGQIFVAFFSTKEGGTGLGLPISAQLAQQNGGRLVLESTSAGGTCFALWLPSTQTDE